MSTFKIKTGYIRAAPARGRKYPFDQLKEGQYFDHAFPMEEAARVKYAMEKYRRQFGVPLCMNRYPNGTQAHPFPHVMVGWPKGAVYTHKPRTKNGERGSDS